MFEIINTHKNIYLKLNDYRHFVKNVYENFEETEDRSVTIVFVSDEKMRELNKLFRNKKKTTDVLSFPYRREEFEKDENLLGEVVISAEQAKKQADENKLSLETEVKQLILHGILHLCGYDHETDAGEMNSIELDLRDKLSINQ